MRVRGMWRIPARRACPNRALVALLALGACSNPFRNRVNFLNRVVRPLTLSGTVLPDETLAGRAVQVNGAYYFLLGKRLSSLGRSDAAIVAFERARKLDDHSAAIHQALAEEYLKKGMTEEGVAMIRKAVELEPDNRDSLLLLAGLHTTAKKFPEAVEIFEKLARKDPDDEEVILNLALIDLEQKRFKPALARLHDFLKRNPESSLAYFYIGRLEQEQGHRKTALEAYKTAVDLRSGFVQAGTYLGFLQEESGDRVGAIETFTWLAAQTDSSRYHKKLGQLLLENSDYQRALQAFLNYERLEPSDLNNRVKIGLLYLEVKDAPHAERKFREVLDEAPESENVRFYLGAALEERKAPRDALHEYERIPESSKLAPEALKRRAWILRRTENATKAVGLVGEVLNREGHEASRERTEELFEIVSAVADGAIPAPVSEVLDGALTRHPKSERLRYVRAVLFEKAGDASRAVSSMESVLKLNPDHAGAMNFIAYLWAEQGVRLPEAERMARRALRLRPKDPFIADSLGWVLYRQGRYRDALKTLEGAFASAPDESVIADHLGDVLVKLGRLAEAKSHYEKALELGPEKDSDRRALESKLAQLVKPTADAGCGVVNKTAVDAPRFTCTGGLREPREPATSRKN
jgi:tetratricopeptide (TPR) repeat protein